MKHHNYRALETIAKSLENTLEASPYKDRIIRRLHNILNTEPISDEGDLDPNTKSCLNIDSEMPITAALPEDWRKGFQKTLTNKQEEYSKEKVNHPYHYQSYGKDDIECIDAMIAAFGKPAVANFCICNSFKYQWRHASKNGMEDIEKSLWYLNKYKELDIINLGE